MKVKIIKVLMICLFATSLHGQKYDVDLFGSKEKIQLNIWSSGFSQHSDSTHITAEIKRIDSLYEFKINSISSNNFLIWSENAIKKIVFPFSISDSDKIVFVNPRRSKKSISILKKDIMKKMKLSQKDLDEMEGYENLLYDPNVLYEAYHLPYIELLKKFIKKEFSNNISTVWTPNFSNSTIPSNLECLVTEGKTNLITTHTLTQNQKEVCAFMLENELKKNEKSRVSEKSIREMYSENCYYQSTEYKYSAEYQKDGDVYSPISISYNKKNLSTQNLEIEIRIFQ